MSRNASLDSLRTIAVLAVFVHHLHPKYLDIGDRGVDLFFVLSGYLIGGILFATYRTLGTIPVWSFWRDRWLRTLPAYFATLAIYVGKQLATSAAMVKTFLPYAVFAQSYVFGSLPRFHHSWSLCVEEHFYLALPIAMIVVAKKGKREWIVPAIVVVGIVLLIVRSYLVSHGHHVNPKMTHWRTDGLIVGVLLAKLGERPQFQALLKRRRLLLNMVTAALVVGASWIDITHVRYFELPFALACGSLVMMGIAHEPWLEALGRTRVVAWLARISYSFYLLHPLVLLELNRHGMGSTRGVPIAVALGLLGSLLAAQLMYTCVEQPGLALRGRLRERARRAAISTHGPRPQNVS